MAFPTTAPLSSALERINAVIVQIKAEAQAIKSASLSGPIGTSVVIAYVGQLADERDLLASLSATPGLAQYAKDQYAQQGLDIAAEFNATLAQVDATRTWVINNFPKAAGGELLEKKFDANGRQALNTFTTVQLAGFRTQLDALIATIA